MIIFIISTSSDTQMDDGVYTFYPLLASCGFGQTRKCVKCVVERTDSSHRASSNNRQVILPNDNNDETITFQFHIVQRHIRLRQHSKTNLNYRSIFGSDWDGLRHSGGNSENEKGNCIRYIIRLSLRSNAAFQCHYFDQWIRLTFLVANFAPKSMGCE